MSPQINETIAIRRTIFISYILGTFEEIATNYPDKINNQ